MQAVPVDFIPQAKPALIELQGQYGRRVSVTNPRLSGDTIYGTAVGGNRQVAVALHEVGVISTRRFSRGRTALLIGSAATMGAALAYVLIRGGAGPAKIECEFDNPVDPYEREVCGV